MRYIIKIGKCIKTICNTKMLDTILKIRSGELFKNLRIKFFHVFINTLLQLIFTYFSQYLGGNTVIIIGDNFFDGLQVIIII